MTTTRTPAADCHPADALLAAFVDGRLGGAEQRLMVEHLALCERCREVVAETARTLRDPELAGWLDDAASGDDEQVEPSGGSGRLLMPPPGRFRRALPWVATLCAAAGVAALLVLTPAGRGLLGLGDERAAVAGLTAGLEGEETRRFFADRGYEEGRQGWEVLMGGDAPALDAEASFQLGVQVAFLDAALRAQESAAAYTLAARVSSRVDPLVASIFYRDLARRIDAGAGFETLLAAHARCEENLRAEGGAYQVAWYDLGRWAAAARLAVVAREASWFDERTHRRELRRATRREWPPAVAAPLASVTGLIAGGIEEGEWPALELAAAELIAAGGDHDGR